MTTFRIGSSGRMLRRLVIGAVLLFLLGAVAWRYSRPDEVAVLVGEVTRGRVERTIANTRAGTVNACRRARLAPAAGGQIATLRVKEGDRVRANQVLLELWNDDAAAETRAFAEQNRSATLRAEEACVRAGVAERDAARAARLHREGLLPEDQLDRAASTAKTLRAGCSAAQAETRLSQARLEAARATLARTLLKAPFDGVVADISGELGEFTTPSPPGIPTPPAVDLIDDSCMYVTAPIDEVDASQIRVGQTGYITIEALPGRRFRGRVRRIAPYVFDREKQARTVDVEVEFENPEDIKALLVGYSADVEIILDARDDAVRVPTEALMEGQRVLVYTGPSEELVERRIDVGLSNVEFTEALSGVSAGERVVLSVERAGVKEGAVAIEEPTTRR